MASDIEKELLDKELRTLMDLYQFHLDLFLKWMTLYTGVVAGVLVYVIVKDPMKDVHPTSVALIVATASAVAAIGCAIMWRWLKTLEKEVKVVAARLGKVQFPPLLGILMTATAFYVTVIFCLIALVVFYKLRSNYAAPTARSTELRKHLSSARKHFDSRRLKQLDTDLVNAWLVSTDIK